ncbi:MAG: tryptophan synthase subunit alpha, partial [Dehalococcoidia bacterium]
LFRSIDGGADAVELSLPFSDPLADGATVQRSTFAALERGVTPPDVLKVTRTLRDQGVETPLIVMGYVNPMYAYGLDRFAADAAAAGIDGIICVDLPPEEAEPILAAFRPQGIDLIFMLAPTSTDARVARVAELASGFIYCVSVTGTTGMRDSVSEELPAFIARVRRHTDLPLAVGFGISRPEHVAQIGQLCEAAIIGSAIIDTIERAEPGLEAERVRTYVEVVTGRQRV